MRYRTPAALEMAVKAAAKASPLDTNLAISGFHFHRLTHPSDKQRAAGMQQDRSPRLPRRPMGVRTNGVAEAILDRGWRGRAHVQHGVEAGRDRGVHQVRAQLRGHDSGAGPSVDAAAISFLLELIERRCTSRSTVLCTQYTPTEPHDRLVHGSARIGLGYVNVRKLLAEGRWRYAPAKQVIRKRRKHRYANRETSGTYVAK
jgi:hypothetical protein